MKKQVHRKSILEDMLMALALELEKSIQSRNKLAICRCLKKCEVLQTTVKDMTRKQ